MRVYFLLVLLALTARGAEPFPFVLPWDDTTPSITNLSGFLPKPAGAQGFVTSKDGHLYTGEKRIRFFGVNMAFGGNFPSHGDAEKVAARMAKYGINCVRFHHMDTGTAPAGLLKADRRTFDPESLDRLDYFIAQLKENGIYANLNLHVGNRYAGMPTWEGASSYFKGVDNFYPPMIEQQQAFARTLLTHVNPYTKLAYTHDPSVALVEINNENGLIMEWNNGALDRMPDPYAAELSKQWNAWLAQRYGTAEKLAAAWREGEEPLGAEMLSNGDFTKRFTDWNLEQHEGAKAVTEFLPQKAAGESSLHLKVEKPGKEGWHVQFTQRKLIFREDQTYTVSFQAYSDKPRKISVSLSQAEAPWKVLATQEIKLGTSWQKYSFPMRAKGTGYIARLSFSNLGQEPGEYHFDDISLRPGGTYGLREGEALGFVGFFRKSEVGGRCLAAQRDWNRFLYDTEVRYWTSQAQFIKQDLGSQSLVLGTATGFSPWPIQAMLDVVDSHSYWQHPHFPRRQWDMNDWVQKNLPMAGAPDGGAIPALGLRRVFGKPFIVTEYNHASPNTYSQEAFLELCAVASLQDWDGVFVFAYSHRLNDWDTRRLTSFFDIDQHPTKMATLPAAVSLFYRGDIFAPKERLEALITPEAAIESIRLGSSWIDGRSHGLNRQDLYRRPAGVRVVEKLPEFVPSNKILPELPVALPSAFPSLVVSNGGEMYWDVDAGRMLLKSPRSAGVIGRVKAGETIDLDLIKIIPGETMQNWATINATVVEGSNFFRVRRVLITATGYTANTGMTWKDAEKTTIGANWGQAPSLVEGIRATIVLYSRDGAKAYALDERGQRKSEIPVQIAGDDLRLEISPAHKTLWWEVQYNQ